MDKAVDKRVACHPRNSDAEDRELYGGEQQWSQYGH